MICIIGESIKIFDELDSTNNFMKQNYSNLDHGSVVVSKRQTNGRGRRTNSWVSEVGNLYFSIVLKNNISRINTFKYIVESSVSIIRLLKSYNIHSVIKYPNDCLVDSKKISGILIENSGPNKLDYLIIGIGINVNQLDFGELNIKATSMKSILGEKILESDVLDEFLRIFNAILNTDYTDIFNEYIDNSIVINKEINYQNMKYVIKSIEQDGTIIISNKTSEHRVAYSEISLKEFY